MTTASSYHIIIPQGVGLHWIYAVRHTIFIAIISIRYSMNKAAFLDRDGTINIDKDYLYKAEDFEYLPGAVEGLRFLQERGFLLVVITNQSGIARGYYTEEDYLALDHWMKEDLAKHGVKITASYYCPHLPDASVSRYAIDCDCRKPKTGLYYRAAEDWNIDLDSSITIGDRMRDLALCRTTGCKGILLNASMSDQSIAGSISRFDSWDDLITDFSFEDKHTYMC